MLLVVEIDEDYYKLLREHKNEEYYKSNIIIANGVPLKDIIYIDTDSIKMKDGD